MNPTEKAHGDLKNILLNGRILLNGMPLTANEISGVLQGEQMLYEKASQFEAGKAAAKNPKTIPFKKPEKKKE